MKVPISEEILMDYGWTVVSTHPWEISHPDGSFASSNAALLVIAALRERWLQEQRDLQEQDEVIPEVLPEDLLKEKIRKKDARIKNLEAFMWAVSKEVRCLPDFYDSLPDVGNAHIMREIKRLVEKDKVPIEVPSDEELLTEARWKIDCQSPFEITHPEGSSATGLGAICVVASLREEWIAEHR